MPSQAVTHCAVISVPHKEWGETPKAVLVKKERYVAHRAGGHRTLRQTPGVL